ncbi:hypothetical protein T03_11273, partial [Trichinella britovi]
DGDPVAVETRLGWIICGPAALSRDRECRVHCIRTDDRLNAALRKFWELEAIGILPPETESGQTEMEQHSRSLDNAAGPQIIHPNRVSTATGSPSPPRITCLPRKRK